MIGHMKGIKTIKVAMIGHTLMTMIIERKHKYARTVTAIMAFGHAKTSNRYRYQSVGKKQSYSTYVSDA